MPSSVYQLLWTLIKEHSLTSQFHKVERVYTELISLFSEYTYTEDPTALLEFFSRHQFSALEFVETGLQDQQFKFLVANQVPWHRNRLI